MRFFDLYLLTENMQNTILMPPPDQQQGNQTAPQRGAVSHYPDAHPTFKNFIGWYDANHGDWNDVVALSKTHPQVKAMLDRIQQDIENNPSVYGTNKMAAYQRALMGVVSRFKPDHTQSRADPSQQNTDLGLDFLHNSATKMNSNDTSVVAQIRKLEADIAQIDAIKKDVARIKAAINRSGIAV